MFSIAKGRGQKEIRFKRNRVFEKRIWYDAKSDISKPVMSHIVETRHGASLQGFCGFIKTGVSKPDLVLQDSKERKKSSLGKIDERASSLM